MSIMLPESPEVLGLSPLVGAFDHFFEALDLCLEGLSGGVFKLCNVGEGGEGECVVGGCVVVQARALV